MIVYTIKLEKGIKQSQNIVRSKAICYIVASSSYSSIASSTIKLYPVVVSSSSGSGIV